MPVDKIGPQLSRRAGGAGQGSGPVPAPAGHAHHEADQVHRSSGTAGDANLEDEINSAAVAAYQASVESRTPLSERKLAGMFDRTSRRWARNRIVEARQARVMT